VGVEDLYLDGVARLGPLDGDGARQRVEPFPVEAAEVLRCGAREIWPSLTSRVR